MSTVHHELAHAKLTRFLHVVGRRDDGYHLLDSEMVTLDLADELTIADGDELQIDDAVDWSAGSGLDPSGKGVRALVRKGERERPDAGVPNGPHNLVNKALALVGRKAAVRLVKRIPAGAGLGGGSADAAAILRWAKSTDLVGAARLGADVPFCLRGGRARVGGIGELLSPLPDESLMVLLVTPALAVSSAMVYAAYDEDSTRLDESARNDLELAAIAVEARLARWRDFLTEVSGLRPVLAGSGSSYFVECAESEGRALELSVRQAIDDVRARAQVCLCRSVGAERQ